MGLFRKFWQAALICLVMTGSPAFAHDGTHSNNSAASKATLEMLKGTEDDRALYQQLRSSWSEIFPSGNRNAGGAVFFKHILDRYTDRDTFMAMNKFYCPVSGSLVDAGSEPEFVYADDAATGAPVCGSLYRCCWPCSCDIMRLASVQQMPFTFDSGPEDIHVFVIDNPCAKDDFPEEVFRGDFCNGEDINTDRVHSVDGKIVIGVLHDGFQCTAEQVAWIGLHRVTGGQCAPRNATPVDKLRGGMGDIFIQLAD